MIRRVWTKFLRALDLSRNSQNVTSACYRFAASSNENSCHLILIKLNRWLFAFQIGVVARPLPTLDIPLQEATEPAMRKMERPASSNREEIC